MGPPTKDSLKIQAGIVQLDNQTKDLCRQIIEKDKIIDEQNLKIWQLKAKLEVILMFLKLVDFIGLSRIFFENLVTF